MITRNTRRRRENASTVEKKDILHENASRKRAIGLKSR
jgi:predicted anti-sigma-YlaC factor YlaD